MRRNQLQGRAVSWPHGLQGSCRRRSCVWLVRPVALIGYFVVALMSLPAVQAGAATSAPGSTAAAQPAANSGACDPADTLMAEGHKAFAVLEYFQELDSPASHSCAIAGLVVLLPKTPSLAGSASERESCLQAQNLRIAGELDSAESVYVADLKADPELKCAKTGLAAVNQQRVSSECLVGRKLLDAHQFDLAVAQFQMAIADAGTAGGGKCGSSGLLEVQAAQDHLSPRNWNDWQQDVVQFGLGLLWALGLLLIVLLLGLIALGWSVRALNRLSPKTLRPRLVPRVRLTTIGGAGEAGSGSSITPLMRSQMLTVQSAHRISFDFVSGDTNVQGLVTAVKAIDSDLGAWAQLAMAFSGLWPWKTMVIQGQALPAGRSGAGITLSIAGEARVPSSVTFWRHPIPASTSSGTTAGVPPATDQDYYDLIPAAATWAVYESARLSRTNSGRFTASEAISSGYLAASYALGRASEPGPQAFLKTASQIDPKNVGVRLLLALSSSDTYDQQLNEFLSILASKWLEGETQPVLTDGIWDVPHA
jgi:hypothetical protein